MDAFSLYCLLLRRCTSSGAMAASVVLFVATRAPSVRVVLSAVSLLLVSETASGMVPVRVTVPVVCAKAPAVISTKSANSFLKIAFLMFPLEPVRNRQGDDRRKVTRRKILRY